MYKTNILELLAQNKVLILDGAMGTSIAKFCSTHQPGVTLNITNPDTIYRIHSEFLKAGANIITTNTFCANTIDLKRYKTPYTVEEINRLAVDIAKKSIIDYQKTNPHKPCFIAGSVGPTAVNISRQTAVTFNEMVANYQEQIAVLLSQNIDLLLLETVIDKENLKAMLMALIDCPKTIPVAVSFAVNSTGKQTILEYDLEEMVELTTAFPVDILGLNCANKMGELQAIPLLRKLSQLPIMVYPNAGFPDKEGNYPISAEQFSNQLQSFITENAIQIVGGCCGTTPQHIKELHNRFSAL